MNKISAVVALSVGVALLGGVAWGQPSTAPSSLDEARSLQLEALNAVGLILLDPARGEADRLRAAGVLAGHGGRVALPLLRAVLLDDPFPSVRRVVAEGLGDFGAPEAQFSLKQAALSGPTASVRWAAGVSLLRVAPEASEVLGVLLGQRDTLAAAALSLQDARAVAAFPDALTEPVVDAFAQAFSDRQAFNNVERAALLKALARLGAQTTVPLLSAAFNDVAEDPFVRGAAAFGLGVLGARQALPGLLSALDNQEEALQVGALGAIVRLNDPRAVPALTALLNSSTASVAVRAAAAGALGALGDETVPALAAVLDGAPEPDLRQAALEALAAVGGKRAGAAVLTFVSSGFLSQCDPAVCGNLALSALAALVKLGEADVALQLFNAAFDALKPALPFVFAFAEQNLVDVAVALATVAPRVLDVLLGDPNPFVAALGLAALPRVRGQAARSTLLRFVDPDQNRLLRRMAFEGLSPLAVAADTPLFAQALFDRDRRTRAAAFEAIARVGDARAVAPLFTALTSDELSLRLQAVAAAIAYGNRVLAAGEPTAP